MRLRLMIVRTDDLIMVIFFIIMVSGCLLGLGMKQRGRLKVA